MNFYTQTLLELIMALGGAMIIGNVIAIVRRSKDRQMAKQALQSSTRASRQTTKVLAKNQIKEGKATLAVAPLGRSLIFVLIGFIVMIWAGVSRFG